MQDVKILIVEDEAIISMELSHRLERAGYKVVATATTGEDAIKKATELTPDLILMDIHINGNLDGVQTVEIIQTTHHIPVIYLTAFSDEKTLERAKLTEPFGFLIKPFEQREVETTIEVALYKSTVEQRRRKNELWLNATLKNINDGIITTDSKGKINFVNDAALKILNANREKVISQYVSDIFNILSYEKNTPLENPVKLLLEGKSEEITNEEFILVKFHSDRIVIEATTSLIEDDLGIISGAVLVFRDISVKKNAAEELRKSEERYRAVVEQSTDGIILYAIDTFKVIKSNLAYQRMSGYSEEELLNLTAFDLMAYNLNHIDDSFNRALKSSKISTGERRERRKDGSIMEVDVTISIVSYLNKEVLCVIVRDISEKKRTEKLIKESEETYRTLFESMTQGIIYQDKAGEIISANPAAFRILGLSIDGMIGRLSLDPKWKTIHKNNPDLKLDEHPTITALKTGKKNTDVTLRIYNPKEKVYKWIKLDAVPEFREGESEPYRIFTTFTDISDQKHLLEEIEKSQESLKEINATKDKFFSILAHDLKSPFQGLLGFSNILAENADDLTKEEITRIATNINKATTNLYQLIDHLLSWSRLQSNRMECNPEKLDLNAIVLYIVNLLTPNAMGKSITLTSAIDPDIFVMADERMLSSILENLISNSIKFTERGGTITVSNLIVKNFAEICISDTGVGMDKEELGRLFRIDQSHSHKGTDGEVGTGLGLILCHEMISKLGGTIHVVSEKGKGSSFYFTLPVA